MGDYVTSCTIKFTVYINVGQMIPLNKAIVLNLVSRQWWAVVIDPNREFIFTQECASESFDCYDRGLCLEYYMFSYYFSDA